MNILLWILQILLAFWNLTGGIYAAFHFDQLKAARVGDLPNPAWVAICVLQVIFAIGVALPPGVLPKLTPIAAIYLAANSLLGCALFAQYSGFPGMLWGVVPAILAAFVAYGRMVLSPF